MCLAAAGRLHRSSVLGGDDGFKRCFVLGSGDVATTSSAASSFALVAAVLGGGDNLPAAPTLARGGGRVATATATSSPASCSAAAARSCLVGGDDLQRCFELRAGGSRVATAASRAAPCSVLGAGRSAASSSTFPSRRWSASLMICGPREESR
ncbi:hypothetical protein QYE76_021105 [Lolium multiflorum]|uniref:Uncharacterized protein n=1 Tax=Lolium multiflorum TaxID=4521 RepID=A0AAD8VST9_LOLMU|nr:hypothetical protein QYE76_021105 [Lolium multiflorum]